VRLVRKVDAAGDPPVERRLERSRLVAAEHLRREAGGVRVALRRGESRLGLVDVQDPAPREAGVEPAVRELGVEREARDRQLADDLRAARRPLRRRRLDEAGDPRCDRRAGPEVERAVRLRHPAEPVLHGARVRDRRRVAGAEKAGVSRRRAGSQLLAALEQRDLEPAPGELVRGAGADRAAADDHDLPVHEKSMAQLRASSAR